MIEIGTFHHKRLQYDEAWLYCACLYENGYNDWRMPDWQEYIDYVKYSPFVRKAMDENNNIAPWDLTDSDQFSRPIVPVRTK